MRGRFRKEKGEFRYLYLKLSSPRRTTPVQALVKRWEHGRTEGKVRLLTPHTSSQAMTG